MSIFNHLLSTLDQTHPKTNPYISPVELKTHATAITQLNKSAPIQQLVPIKNAQILETNEIKHEVKSFPDQFCIEKLGIAFQPKNKREKLIDLIKLKIPQLKNELDNPAVLKNFNTVFDAIGYDPIYQLFFEEKFNVSESKKLFWTLICIGEKLSSKQVKKYVNIIDFDQKVSRNSFYLSETALYINLRKTSDSHILGEGTSKIATRSFKISLEQSQSIQEVARIKAKTTFKRDFSDKINNLKKIRKKQKEVENINKALALEEELLESLSDNPFVIRPYIDKSQNKNSLLKKMIYYQEIYSSSDEFFKPDTALLKKINFLENIAEGLMMMHEEGFVHLDIKPANLYSTTENGVAKGLIGDLGLTRDRDDFVQMGTPLYAAPEVFSLKKNSGLRGSKKMDSYSFGLVILQSILSPIAKKNYHLKKIMQNSLNKISSEREIDECILLVQQSKANKSEKDAKCETLKLCKKLLCIDPKKRDSCKKAFKKLKEIKENYQNSL